MSIVIAGGLVKDRSHKWLKVYRARIYLDGVEHHSRRPFQRATTAGDYAKRWAKRVDGYLESCAASEAGEEAKLRQVLEQDALVQEQAVLESVEELG